MWPDRRTFVLSALIVVAAVAASIGLSVTDDDNSPTSSPEGTESSSERTTTTRRRASTTTAPRTSITGPTAPAEHALVVTEQGYSVFPSSSGDFTMGSYGAVISNPNANVAATDIDIDVTFTDAGGAIVGRQSELIELLLPGQSSAIGGPMNDLGSETRTMHVDVVDVAFEPVTGVAGAITIDGVDLIHGGDGLVTTGVAHSSFEAHAPFVTVVVLYRDATNRIVGADVGSLDAIPPGGAVPFEVEGFDQVPNVVSATPVASLPLELLGN